jgi:hypothetical protein
VLASDIFNREFAKLNADWVKRPITLTLAGVQTGISDLRQPPETLVDQAKRLLALREELAAEEERRAAERMHMARDAMRRPEPERVEVPSGEWRTWFQEGGDG